MQLTQIDATVNNLQWPDYDINVWSRDGYVYLTFYPLRYPGDKYYPDADLDHGLPIVDTSVFYSLKIDPRSRGPLRREALQFLQNLVNEDHVEHPDLYPSELWSTEEDGMDWWSCETALHNAPELIQDFISTLPARRS
jgi:hypothetical protein